MILIENGRIIDKNIKRLRITINELMMKLRQKDVFNLDDVQLELEKKNINHIEEAFYVGIDKDKKLTISKRYTDDFKPENKFSIE